MPQARRLTPASTRPQATFYGWLIVAVSGLTLLVAFGIRLSFTVFFVALIRQFDWPREGTALIFSVSMIVFALTSTAAGISLDRWGARRTFGAGAALLALGLLLSSRVNALWQLALSYGVVAGLGITILGLGPQAGLIARWFRRKRGLALGLAFSGTGLGALLLTPGVEWFITSYGWRPAYLSLAILSLLLIPPIALFLRREPSTLGLLPDGHPLESGGARPELPSETWTLSQAASTLRFWLVVVAGLGAIGPLRMLTVHQMAVAVDAGFPSLFAATVIGAAGAVTAVAHISFGALSDRIGRRSAYAIGSFCLLSAIATLANLHSAQQAGWFWLYAVLLGLGEGSRSSLVTAVASDLFPGTSLGAINGAVGAAFGLGAAIFPWLAGRIFDQSGAYTTAFQLAAIAIILSTISLWLASATIRRRQMAA